MITRMNHTGFIVADLDKSVEFYLNVMGLKMVREVERNGGRSLRCLTTSTLT